MSLKIRLSVAVLFAAVFSAAAVLLLQSHAAAGKAPINYAHLTKIQKRIISETLASALGPQPRSLTPHVVPGNGDQGGGPDGAPRVTTSRPSRASVRRPRASTSRSTRTA